MSRRPVTGRSDGARIERAIRASIEFDRDTVTIETEPLTARAHRDVPHPYIPLTDDDRAAMLATIGAASTDDAVRRHPGSSTAIPRCDLPDALTELELLDEMRTLAARNRTAADYACFLGAGAYRHFRPSLVDPLVMRGEFLTSYTPYQPEVSQGTLQTIFEFQSLVCELTGMDVANAGMYDGASALAEACLMACAVTGRAPHRRSRERVHPNWLAVVQGYAHGRDIARRRAAARRRSRSSDEHACLAVAQPDFFGRMSLDAAAWGDAAHAAGALYVVAAEPISLGMYRPPSEYGADIVVARGAVARRAAVVRRAVRRPVRLPREVHPPDAGPHRRPDDGPRRPHAATC